MDPLLACDLDDSGGADNVDGIDDCDSWWFLLRLWFWTSGL
jgi:hypothetical protein